MEMIITKVMIDSIKETIKDDNTMFELAGFILGSIAKEAKADKKVTVRKIQDLLAIQNVFITTYDEHLANKNLSKEQIEERIKILDVLQEMTKSLFNDAFDALNKRLDELKNERQVEYKDKLKDELDGLTRDELIDLIKKLEQEQEQK